MCKVLKYVLTCIFFTIGFLSFGQRCDNWLRLPSYPSYVAIGDLDIPGNQITIEAQINMTEPYLGGPSLGSDIVGKYADPSDANYLLRAQNAQITTSDGFFQTPDVCDLVTNKTYHVAMVYDGATLKFYRNGFLQSQVPATGNLFQNNWITQIGFYQFAFYNVNLIGYINEVRIWNVARTQAQLNSFINIPLPTPAAQAGLLAYYTFDDLLNKQGNAAWNGSLGGTAIINQTNPNCPLVVANDCCPILSGSISGNTICPGEAATLTFHTNTTIRQPYTIKYSDGTNSYTQTNVQDGIPFNVAVQPSTTKIYTLQSIQGASSCAPTPITGQSTTITVGSCSNVIASFTAPDEVCQNTPVNIVNTSVGATTYLWNFCSTNFSQPPDGLNIGNPGNLLSGVVFTTVAQDISGNYFVFATNNYNAHVTRLNFGNSLLNTPVADDLGDFGGKIPRHTEGIQIVNTNGRWFAIVQGGDPSAGDASSIAKIDFGASLASTSPTCTNWGNIGNLNYPHELYLFQENNRWYGYASNSNSNTLTRYDFGTDFSATPTGINLGNLGNLNLPVGITAINHAGLWHLFVLNDLDGTITRLDFGNSLLNTPTAINIGNPQGNLNTPRDISFIELCDDIKAIVVNANPNSISQLDFGTDLTSVPTAISLGNIGNLNFPHSISTLFRVNNDIFAFIPNVNDGTLTRIRFAGCDLSPSTKKDPDPITYPTPGVYYINLLTDIGLPSQSSYCKQITVKDCCPTLSGTITGNSVCNNGTAALTFHAAVPTTDPFIITYSDGTNVYTQKNVLDGIPFILPVQPKISTQYTLMSIQGLDICAPTMITGQNAMIQVSVLNVSSDTSICPGSSLTLQVSGSNSYSWSPAQYLDNPNAANPVASPPVSTMFYVTATDLQMCISKDSIKVNIIPPTIFNKPPDVVTCSGKPALLNGNNKPSFKYNWSPADQLNDPAIANPVANPDQSTDFQVTITDPVCNVYAQDYSVHVTVNPSPEVDATRSNEIDCSNLTSHLNASGAENYTWFPNTGLDKTDIANPVARISETTQYTVQGVSLNGCTGSDSITIVVTKTGQNAFLVPNAFTPNGDNVNDCFGVKNWGSVILQQFTIYNRWGQIVFETKNPSACWDGTFQGVLQPAGGFVYLIRASSFCGDVSKKGTLLLIR